MKTRNITILFLALFAIFAWYKAGDSQVRIRWEQIEPDVQFDSLTLQDANAIIFEGATVNDFETTVAITDPTADRIVTVPDEAVDLGLIDNVANVHGLGANVNVLGNRDASGEFIQRATVDTAVPASSTALSSRVTATDTYAVAFNNIPRVMMAGVTPNEATWAEAHSVTTTGFSIEILSDGTTTRAVQWVALGD